MISKLRQLFPDTDVTKIHQLRSIYAYICWELYGKKKQMARHDYVATILGHDGYGSVPNYSTVKVINLPTDVRMKLDEMKINGRADTKAATAIIEYHDRNGGIPTTNWLRKTKKISHTVAKRVLDNNAAYINKFH